MQRNSEIPEWSLPNGQRYLLVFDVHQNIAWLERILEAEKGNYDHLILGGDYFDAYEPPPSTATALDTAAFLNNLLESQGNALTILLGNHDLPYLVASRMANPGFFYHPFSDIKGYNTETAKELASVLNPSFWSKAQLFVQAHGFLISHAGVAAKFWPEADSVDASLALLWERGNQALAEAKQRRDPLLEPGRARGGSKQERGGITWQDWDTEFSDEEIPLPQIVGHTRSAAGARQTDRSWCLDGQQSCYGLLGPDGLDGLDGLKVKSV